MKKSFFEFNVKDSQAHDYSLSQHTGKVVLAVNVASKCGFTPQYKGLEKLYQDFKNDQFIILGFPCNQFGAQEPGSASEIQSFCELNYGVTFPVLAKINVNGDDAADVFKHLKKEAPGLFGTQMIKWNFTKFLINKKGDVIKRYSPNTDPLEIAADIKKALAD